MPPLFFLFIGIAAGVGLAIPLAMLAARRTARRVRQLEQRARTNERLAELGTMTGGLAHEIKNPLSTIGLNLQLLRETLNDTDLPEADAARLRRRLQAISDEADRLRDILEDFLRYAGRIQLDRQWINLNELADQLVDFYAPQAEQSGVNLRAKLDSRMDKVYLDPALVKQAALNLLINATQAMVEARYSEKPHGGATDLFLQTELDAETAKLHIIDTGPGIAPDMIDRIFHPYYSSKKGGSGLGLPVSRRIVEEHGGTLRVHSTPGKGTDFTLQFPTEPAPEDDAHDPAPDETTDSADAAEPEPGLDRDHHAESAQRSTS